MDLTGKIKIDGRETEFLLTAGEDGGWQQWGGDRSTLGGRVDLVTALSEALNEWARENLCTECSDHLLDDGEGFDGKCGNCADRAEKEAGNDN